MLDGVVNTTLVNVSTLNTVRHDCVFAQLFFVNHAVDWLSSREVFLGLSLTFVAFT